VHISALQSALERAVTEAAARAESAKEQICLA